jgi:hypothetical protein
MDIWRFSFFANSLLIDNFISLPSFAAIDQRTTPPVLPIYGDPNEEIALELLFPKGEPVFTVKEKSLQLIKPLDRDEDNLSHIMFQVHTLNTHFPFVATTNLCFRSPGDVHD